MKKPTKEKRDIRPHIQWSNLIIGMVLSLLAGLYLLNLISSNYTYLTARQRTTGTVINAGARCSATVQYTVSGVTYKETLDDTCNSEGDRVSLKYNAEHPEGAVVVQHYSILYFILVALQLFVMGAFFFAGVTTLILFIRSPRKPLG